MKGTAEEAAFKKKQKKSLPCKDKARLSEPQVTAFVKAHVASRPNEWHLPCPWRRKEPNTAPGPFVSESSRVVQPEKAEQEALRRVASL